MAQDKESVVNEMRLAIGELLHQVLTQVVLDLARELLVKFERDIKLLPRKPCDPVKNHHWHVAATGSRSNLTLRAEPPQCLQEGALALSGKLPKPLPECTIERGFIILEALLLVRIIATITDAQLRVRIRRLLGMCAVSFSVSTLLPNLYLQFIR